MRIQVHTLPLIRASPYVSVKPAFSSSILPADAAIAPAWCKAERLRSNVPAMHLSLHPLHASRLRVRALPLFSVICYAAYMLDCTSRLPRAALQANVRPS